MIIALVFVGGEVDDSSPSLLADGGVCIQSGSASSLMVLIRYAGESDRDDEDKILGRSCCLDCEVEEKP